MAGQDLLIRVERALPNIKELAKRMVALETAVRDNARAAQTTAGQLGERLSAVERRLAGEHEGQDSGDAVPRPIRLTPAEAHDRRFQEYARVIQQLQDRIIRLERANRELAVRLEQLMNRRPAELVRTGSA